MKNYLFILRKPAHSGAFAQEMLDIILTTAAFDQHTSVLLLDDAVFHVKKEQGPKSPGMKDIAAIYRALEIYDVRHVYAEAESLKERGLKPGDLCLSVEAVYRKDIPLLLRRHDLLFPG